MERNVIRIADDKVVRVDLTALSQLLLGLIDPIKVAAEIEEMNDEICAIIARDYYHGWKGFFRHLFRLVPRVTTFPPSALDDLVSRIRDANGHLVDDVIVSLINTLTHGDVSLVVFEEL